MSHARNCAPYLLAHGYPLDAGTAQGLRDNHFTFDEQQAIKAMLGQMRANDLPSFVWGWSELGERIRQVYAVLFPGRLAP